MSSDAPHRSSVHNVSPTTSERRPRRPAAAAAAAAAVQRAGESVTIAAMPLSPPPEVLDAIGAAARAYDRLTANGVQLHFHVEEETGKVAVHVNDTHGCVLGSLAPSQALELATSAPLD